LLWHAGGAGERAVITLYHARFTRSVRVRWLLEELGLPHDLMTLPEADGGLAEGSELLPTGEVPLLRDGDVVLFESGAIVQYLLDGYGHGRLEPARHAKDRAEYLQWFHFAEAALGPHLSAIARQMHRPEVLREPTVAREAVREIERPLAVLDAALAAREWLLESFSAADVMLGWSVVTAERYALLEGRFPSVGKYATRILNRPLFRRSMYT
jgi:glutathione S-transferase